MHFIGISYPMQTYIHSHKADLIRVLVIVLALLFRGLKLNDGMAPFDFASLFAALAGGYPIFTKAMEGLKKRKINIYCILFVAGLFTLCTGAFGLALIIALIGMLIIIFNIHIDKMSLI